MLQTETGSIVSHVVSDEIKKRENTLFHLVGAHAFRECIHLLLRLLDPPVELMVIIRQYGFLKKRPDPPNDTGSINCSVPLDASPFIIHVRALEISLRRHNCFLNINTPLAKPVKTLLKMWVLYPNGIQLCLKTLQRCHEVLSHRRPILQS